MVKKKHVNDPPCDKDPVSISVGDHDEELFEEQHVHRIYEDISVHFSHTRYGPWKNVVRLVNEAPANSFILDVGCGNGKYLNSRSDCFFLGVDVCSALLQICSEKGNISSEKNKTDLLLSNNLRLGVRDNAADLTLSIAVIHHVSTVKRRLDAIGELIRCTRPKGKILIYVWSFEQDRNYVGYREFKSQDVLVPWNLQSVYANAAASTANPIAGTAGDGIGSGGSDGNTGSVDGATATGGVASNTATDDATATGGGIANASIGNARIGSTLISSTGIVNTSIDRALVDSKTIGSTRTDNNTTINNNTKNLESYGRYYHVFTREEVDRVCWHFRDDVDYAVGSDCNNWVIEMTKR